MIVSETVRFVVAGYIRVFCKKKNTQKKREL